MTIHPLQEMTTPTIKPSFGSGARRLCAQAFPILTTAGFRDARTFVVSTHDQLRARSKELEGQNTIESE